MILIVDDDEHVRAIVRFALQDLGYETSEAPDGPTALDMISRRRPDLVILDFVMPRMNGVKVATELAKLDPSIPIIFASGFSDRIEIEDVLLSKRPILQKPFLFGELSKLVSEQLQAVGPGGKRSQSVQ